MRSLRFFTTFEKTKDILSTAYLLTGSNLGNREENLKKALHETELLAGKIEKISSIYETAAWGKTDQPAFLNQVLEIKTSLDPEALLRGLKNIEKKMGRTDSGKWGSRVIDIDILYYEDHIIVRKGIKIPHPGIQHRKFTLVPLVEIAPDFRHPVLNISNREMLERCGDGLEVRGKDEA